jgi:hypothetical protein
VFGGGGETDIPDNPINEGPPPGNQFSLSFVSTGSTLSDAARASQLINAMVLV